MILLLSFSFYGVYTTLDPLTIFMSRKDNQKSLVGLRCVFAA